MIGAGLCDRGRGYVGSAEVCVCVNSLSEREERVRKHSWYSSINRKNEKMSIQIFCFKHSELIYIKKIDIFDNTTVHKDSVSYNLSMTLIIR